MAIDRWLPSKETSPIDDPENFLWITLEAYELKSQKVLARSEAAIIKGSPQGKFNILAPMTIQESFSHTWNNSTSPIQDMAQKLADTQKSSRQLFSSSESGATELEKVAGASQNNGSSTNNQNGVDKASLTSKLNPLSQSMLNADGQMDRVYKVDTMKTYDSSSNRKWDFSVECGFKRNRQIELLDPIKELLSLSCAEMKAEDVSAVDYPAIFSLKVGKFIIAKNVILSSVTVSWEGPYKDGLPTKALLNIQLEEIEPLYRKTLKDGTTISTSSDTSNTPPPAQQSAARSPVSGDTSSPAQKTA